MKVKQLGSSIYIPVGPIKIPAGIFLAVQFINLFSLTTDLENVTALSFNVYYESWLYAIMKHFNELKHLYFLYHKLSR